MRAQCEQVGEVHDDERREDKVGAGPSHERDSEAEDQCGAEPVPQPADEGDRRGVVVLEPEPTFAGESLHAERFVQGLVTVHEHEWIRREKGRQGQRDGYRNSSPLLPARNDEWHEQEDARILEAHCDPGGDAAELEPARHEQGESHGNPERQRYVGHGGSRIGDVDRAHGHHRGCDQAGRRGPECAPAEPPGSCDRAQCEHDTDDPRCQIGRLVLPELERRVDSLGRMRALGFCVSVKHAQFMAARFNQAGIAARAVSGESSRDERAKSWCSLGY